MYDLLQWKWLKYLQLKKLLWIFFSSAGCFMWPTSQKRLTMPDLIFFFFLFFSHYNFLYFSFFFLWSLCVLSFMLHCHFCIWWWGSSPEKCVVILSLPLLLYSFLLRVVVFFWVASLGHKPVWKLLVLDRNIGKFITLW